MSNSLEQSEVLSLQKQIICWFQKQILSQHHPTTIETGQMMELLGKALEYHSTLIDLEQRLQGVSSSTQQETGNGMISSTYAEPIGLTDTKAEMPKDDDLHPLTLVEEEEPIVARETEAKTDRVYFSLAAAYELALKEGFLGTQSAFREKFRKSETPLGWHKELDLGSKPCYYRG